MGNPLPPDESGEIKSDLAAMRRDADEWEAAAERMGNAATAAQGLALGDYELSIFGADTGLADAYRDIQQWTAGLLAGAHKNLANMAKALRVSADNYQASDERGAAGFKQLQGGN